MKICYRRELRKNYLVIDRCGEGTDFEERMLLNARLPGIIRPEPRYEEGRKRYYYNISGMQPLARIREIKSMDCNDIGSIILQIGDIISDTARYMLPESMLLLSPDFIYMEPESFRIRLCALPSHDSDAAEEMRRLSEYFILRADRNDMNTVRLTHELFLICRREIFGIKELTAAVETARKRRNSVSSESKQEIGGVFEPVSVEASGENKDTGEILNDAYKRTATSALMQKPDKVSERAAENHREKPETAGIRYLRTTGYEGEEWPAEEYKNEMERLPGAAEDKDDPAAARDRGMLRQLVITALIMAAVPAAIYILRGEAALIRFMPVIAVADIGIAAYGLVGFAERSAKRKRESVSVHEGISASSNISEAENCKPQERKAVQDAYCSSGKIGKEHYQAFQTRKTEHDTGTGQRLSAKRICMNKRIAGEVKEAGSRGARKLKALGHDGVEIQLPYFPFILGRSNGINDFSIDDESVSAMHAKIEETEEGYRLTDLNTESGTRVGERVLSANESVRLNPGDEVYIGELGYVFA